MYDFIDYSDDPAAVAGCILPDGHHVTNRVPLAAVADNVLRQVTPDNVQGLFDDEGELYESHEPIDLDDLHDAVMGELGLFKRFRRRVRKFSRRVKRRARKVARVVKRVARKIAKNKIFKAAWALSKKVWNSPLIQKMIPPQVRAVVSSIRMAIDIVKNVKKHGWKKGVLKGIWQGAKREMIKWAKAYAGKALKLVSGSISKATTWLEKAGVKKILKVPRAKQLLKRAVKRMAPTISKRADSVARKRVKIGLRRQLTRRLPVVKAKTFRNVQLVQRRKPMRSRLMSSNNSRLVNVRGRRYRVQLVA